MDGSVAKPEFEIEPPNEKQQFEVEAPQESLPLDAQIDRNGVMTPVRLSSLPPEERMRAYEYHPPDPKFAQHTYEGAKTGLMGATAPLMLGATIPELVGGTIGGAAGGYGGRKLAEHAGMGEFGQEVVGDVGGLGGAFLGTAATRPIVSSWEQGRLPAMTKRAVSEGRASALPTRVPTMRESPMTSPPPLRWNPVTKSMERVAPPPVRFNPKVAEPVSASVAPPPIKFGAKAAEPEMVAPPPVRFSPRAAEEVPTAKAPIPPVRWMKTPKGGVAPPITSGGAELPVRVPEPRTPFAGEQEGYMASVPREELGELAKTRKPGAGTQMQQLGKRIIYIPKEADYP